MSAKQHALLSAKLQQVLPLARAELMTLPLTPQLQLFLINNDYPQHELTADEMLAVMNYPAYWAFCWASGQVLAQFITEQPQWVSGKRVLDFGSGSGVVAIAAAKAGAKKVVACDNDHDAIAAIRANADINQVDLEITDDFHVYQEGIDIIIVADVLYDRANLSWLDQFLLRAKEVLVADSRVNNFSFPPYTLIEQRQGSTIPDLDEFDEFRDVRIYYADKRD